MTSVDNNLSRYARYPCTVCSRPFDRKDALARHMQVHDKSRPNPKTKRKACLSCSQSKIRCNGEQPTCSSCRKRNITCTFPEPRTLQSRISRALNHEGTLTESFRAFPQPSTVLPSVEHAPSSTDNSPFTENHSMKDSTGQGYPRDSPQARHQRLSTDMHLEMPAGLTPNMTFTSFDHLDFNSNLDWILEATSSDDLLWGSDNFDARGFPDGGTFQHHNMPASQRSVPPINHACELSSGSTKATTSQSQEPLAGLLIPQPQATRSYGDPWPLETPRPPQRHITLPALGSDRPQHIPTDRYYHIKPTTDETWYALQRCLRSPFDYSSLQSLSLEYFPSKEKLDHCIDLYFTHFQPTLAIIHLPTFDPGDDLVVTLAVICIGACYTEFDGLKAFSTTLSDLIRRLLVFLAEHDHRFVRTRSYLSTQLLQGVRKYSPQSSLRRPPPVPGILVLYHALIQY
jgi:hypothetical protein